MKKLILGAILSFSIISCSNSGHKHDGIYNGKVDFMGMDLVNLTYKINGSELIIENGISEPTKINCKQTDYGIEYLNDKGESNIIYISENGELMVNDKIKLYKIQSNSNFNESSENILAEIKKGDIDDFYSISSDMDKDKKPLDIVYIYKGNIQNKSTQLFENSVVSLEVDLVLENGNTLTKKEYGRDYLGEGIMAINNIKDWKSKEVKEIKGLLSVDIPVKYIDYPIKSVIAKYSFECEDQINNTTENFVIEKDITEKWNSVTKRIQDGNADYKEKGDVYKLFR